MNNEIVIDNIANHLNLLEGSINTVIILSLAVVWAGIQRKQHITLFGNTFNRRYAFFVVAGLYLVVNFFVFLTFLRLGDLILLLKDGNSWDRDFLIRGITQYATHRWLLNPYSYFSITNLTSVQSAYSSLGIGLLILVWWICTASLYSLMDDKRNIAARVLFFLFIIIGNLTLVAIYRGFFNALDASECFPDINELLYKSMMGKTKGTIAGNVSGIAFFITTYILQKKWLKSQKDLYNIIGKERSTTTPDL